MEKDMTARQGLNVCLINDSFPPSIDGVANTVVNYAKIINAGLGKASVVTPYYPETDDSAYDFDVIRYPSIDTTRLVGYRAGIPFSAESAARMMEKDFDIIHSHCPVTATMYGRIFRDMTDRPLVLTYHTKIDIDIEKAIRMHLLQEGATRILVDNISACDEVWTVSRGAGDNLRKLGYEGDFVVMPNGVDFPRGRLPEDRVRELTAGYDIPEGVPVFLYVGRMMWYKGLRITLDALQMLSETGRDFRMVFVGGGADKDDVVAYAEAQKLDKVIFVPPTNSREEVRAWCCRADLFLFPSTFDTNGLVVREAAACGLASVLIKGSCAAEDSADGVNSFLINEDPLSMFTKIEELLGTPEKLKTVGEEAQRSLYLSWEDSVKNAYDRYGTVLENYKRGESGRQYRVTDLISEMNARTLEDYVNFYRWFNSFTRGIRNNILDVFK